MRYPTRTALIAATLLAATLGLGGCIVAPPHGGPDHGHAYGPDGHDGHHGHDHDHDHDHRHDDGHH